MNQGNRKKVFVICGLSLNSRLSPSSYKYQINTTKVFKFLEIIFIGQRSWRREHLISSLLQCAYLSPEEVAEEIDGQLVNEFIRAQFQI